MSGKSEGTIPSNEYVYFNNVVLQTYTTAHKNKIHYKTSAASGESPKWLKTNKNISDTLHRHYFEGLISRQRKQWSAGFIKRFQWMTIKPKRRFVSSRFHIWSYIKKRGLPFQEEELPANIWSPSSDMHIANTKPLPSSEATPGMLRPVSKLPQAFKSITHTSNKHTARATEYRAASWLGLFDIVWKERRGEEGYKAPQSERDDGTRDSTYSHLMPEQTCDSSKALSTPRGRTGGLLLMVRHRFQFTQGVSTKEAFGRLNSRLSYHSCRFFESWKRWHNDGTVQEFWIRV